jgi:hypothetical protein
MATNPFGPQTGLLGLLGAGGNPIYRSLKDGGLLDSLAYGLASGTGLSDGLQKAALAQIGGRNDREERALKAAEWDKTQQQQNATRALLAKEAPDLAQLLDTGVPMGEVWGEYFRRKSPQGGAKPIEVNGQLIDPNTFEVLGDFRTPETAGGGDQPASVKEYQFAVSQGYDKPYQTFIQEKGRNAGTPPATIAKEIFEADEGAQAGQNVITALDKALEINATAWDGPLADVGSSGAALFGNPEAVQTQELKNIVTANALESLKATFGAAPTEGERKILLEVQGSINQPRAVREAIFKRARAAAERRLKFNQERAGALRNDEYFAPGYSPVGGASGGNSTSTGVTWSIEP